MKALIPSLILSLAIAAPPLPAWAQSPVDTLGRCLTDNTTGKDRKDLARWIFVAMSAHPEMKPLSAVSTADTETASRTTAELFMRLLADTCPKEAKAAIAAGGTSALQLSFQVLGQMAMQELMANPEVATAISAIERYIDQERLDAALGQP